MSNRHRTVYKRSEEMDYQPLYYARFNKITDVIEALQNIQRETEEMYILAAEPNGNNEKISPAKDPEAGAKTKASQMGK